MEFFSDRDLGRHEFPGLLRSAGITVHRHADHFRHDTPDRDWLPQVAARRWVVLTNDRKIRSRALEVRAVMTSGARVIALVGGSLTAAELAQNFLNTFAKIETFAADRPMDRACPSSQPRRGCRPRQARLDQADPCVGGLGARVDVGVARRHLPTVKWQFRRLPAVTSIRILQR